MSALGNLLKQTLPKISNAKAAPQLSNPRAPTTSAPLSKVAGKVIDRVVILPPRMPDRGGFRPMNGMAQRLPNGDLGGFPKIPPPLWQGLEKMTLPKVGQSTAMAITQAIKQARVVEIVKQKPVVKLEPGLSALAIAKAPRTRIGFRNGAVDRIVRHALPGNTPVPASRGQFARHRTVPTDTLVRLAAARMSRNTFGTALAVEPSAAGREVTAPMPEPLSEPQVTALSRGGSVRLNSTSDIGQAAVRPAPEPTITTGVGEGTSQLLLVGLAGLALWFFFRGRGA